MSEEPAKPAAPAAPAPARGGKALVLLLVLNIGATGFIAFKVVTAHPAEAAPAPAAPAEAVAGPMVALDPFVVNLDEPGTARYLRVTLQLELFPDAEPTLEKNKHLVRDAILGYLSGLHVKDTLGTEAKDHIRTDVLARLAKLVGPTTVHGVFFQEFVVQ